MFGQNSDSAWYYSGSIHLEAQNRLMYVAEQAEPFVLLLGAQGMGKSRLLQEVQTECQRCGRSAVRINVSALDENAFLWHLCGGLSIVPQDHHSRSQMMSGIRDEISGRVLCNHQTVVLLDDLHRASGDLTLMIQFLIALNQQTRGGISVIAAAESALQPELQRLSALRVQLPPLTDDEATQFVTEALRALQIDVARLTPDSLLAIVESCEGSPAQLTRTCELLKITQSANPDLTINAHILGILTEETLTCRS